MTNDIYMLVVSAYALTAKAPPAVKAKFFKELQDGLDSVPAGDILVVLGASMLEWGKEREPLTYGEQ